MRIVIFLLLISGIANGQIINGSSTYRVRTAPSSCPNVLVFGTLSNFTENTPGTYTLTSAASDGNGTSSTTLPSGVDSVIAYFEYQSADGFQSAISWDTVSTQSTPYYSQCKFNVLDRKSVV